MYITDNEYLKEHKRVYEMLLLFRHFEHCTSYTTDFQATVKKCQLTVVKQAGEYMKRSQNLNCGERYKDMNDHRSYVYNLSSCENNA